MASRRFRSIMMLLALAAVPATWPGAAGPERGPLPGAAPTTSNEDPDGARVIVKFKALGSLMRGLRSGGERTRAPLGPQLAATLSARHGLALVDGRIIEGRSQVVRGDKSLSSAALAARIATDPEVEYAVPDLRRYPLAAPNDPLFAASASISPAAGQWYLQAPDATLVSAVNAPGAWAITSGSPGVVVADIDTGVRFDHPDLANKLYPGYDFIANLSNAADGGGRDADASDPGDWSSAGGCGSGSAASNSSWHGTKVAGLIGAQTNNGIGIASIGSDLMLLPVRALGKCGGTDSDIIAGMLWAGGVTSNPVANPHPARVINLSLGGSGGCNSAYADAVNQLTAAGVVVVAAAGNDEGLAVAVPANCPGVIAVAGVRHAGTKVGFSSVGPEVAIAAPAGNCVNTSGACLYPMVTTSNAGATTPGANSYSDSSSYTVGTSFATPLVSATVGLMLSAAPSLSPARVKAMLQASARPFPATSSDASVTQCHAPNGVAQDECLCTTSTCGAGLLDAAGAVAAAAASATPVATITPATASVVAGGSLVFDGSASIAPAGRTIVAYRWSAEGASALAAISGAADASTVRITAFGIGAFNLRLTVTDSAGQSASVSVAVSVTAPAAPVVRVLASASVVDAGGSVSFDGSGSTAASGLAIVAYEWAIVGGSSVAAFSTPTDAAGASIATLGAGSGVVTIRLTVTDSLGQQASATTDVSVVAVRPTASISATATTVSVGGSVGFDGSASTATAGRTLSGCAWTITTGSAIASFSGATNVCVATVTATAVGTFSVQLTVTDSVGATDSRTTAVTVTAPQSAATVTTGSGGSGGGAMGPAWLAALAGAAVALAWPRRRRPA